MSDSPKSTTVHGAYQHAGIRTDTCKPSAYCLLLDANNCSTHTSTSSQRKPSTTMPNKPTATGGSRGNSKYTYMELLSEWALNDREQDWKEQAACKGMDRSIFFPALGYNQHSKVAIKICKTCPVKQRCTEFAINNKIAFGIWGGLNPNQRQQLKLRKTK